MAKIKKIAISKKLCIFANFIHYSKFDIYFLLEMVKTIKNLFAIGLLSVLGVGVSFSQEDKDNNMFDSGMEQIIVPVQINTSPTDGDTINTLVTAEGEEANVMYNIGVTQCNEGNYDDAIVTFSNVLRMNSEMAQAYYGRSSCYMQQKRYDDAINDLKEYTKRKEDNYATYLIGYCYFHKSDEKSALTYFQNAIEQGCNKADLFYHIGVINFNEAKYDEAMKYYTRAIEIDDTHAFSYNDRGSTYRMLDKIDKAIEDYNKAVQLNPRMDIFKANLGSAYRINKNYEKAIEAYDDVLKTNPENYIVLNNKGIVQYEMKEYDKAIETLNECLNQKKDYAYAFNNLGLCYYKKKEYSHAIEAFTKAIGLNPNYGEAYVGRGAAKEMSRDMTGACSDWEKAESLGVTNLHEYQTLCNEYK